MRRLVGIFMPLVLRLTSFIPDMVGVSGDAPHATEIALNVDLAEKVTNRYKADPISKNGNSQ